MFYFLRIESYKNNVAYLINVSRFIFVFYFFIFGVDSCSGYERISVFRGKRSSSDENFKTKINLKNYNIERKKRYPIKLEEGCASLLLLNLPNSTENKSVFLLEKLDLPHIIDTHYENR